MWYLQARLRKAHQDAVRSRPQVRQMKRAHSMMGGTSVRGGPCGARSNPPGEVVQTAHRLQDYPRRLHTRPSIRPRSMKPAGLGSVVRAVRQTGQKICRRWHHRPSPQFEDIPGGALVLLSIRYGDGTLRRCRDANTPILVKTCLIFRDLGHQNLMQRH